MTATHAHDDPRTLTWGCPACVKRVRRDQEAARWRDAPVRRCTWSTVSPGDFGPISFSADVRVPTGADEWQVEYWHARVIDQGISEALTAAGCPADDVLRYMAAELRCTIGPVVEDVAATPTIDHPSLFGALQ